MVCKNVVIVYSSNVNTRILKTLVLSHGQLVSHIQAGPPRPKSKKKKLHQLCRYTALDIYNFA